MSPLARLILPVLTGGILFACSSDAGDIYSPEEWRGLFKENGWTALPFPDSKYEPGAIIKVSEADGLRYIDHLRTCGYPPDILSPEVGKIPSISFTKTRELGAAAMLNIKGITAGPEFSNVAKARLEVSEHSADALRLVALRIWQETPGNLEGNARFCVEELEKPDYYLITEAFRVSKGRYTLYDETGGKLKVSLANLGKILSLEPSVKYEVSGEGELVIEERVTFAIRRAISTTAGFEVLGAAPGEAGTADEAIDRIYQESVKP